MGHDVRIQGLCGSLQANSKNLALLKVAATSVPPGVELVIFTDLSDLPHFNPDIELSSVPESALRWRQALAEWDTVLVASPDYVQSARCAEERRRHPTHRVRGRLTMEYTGPSVSLQVRKART